MNPPVPTALKILRGNPGKRAINHSEPQPKLAIPPCPSSLDEEARKEWKRMGKELFNLGLLTKIDKAGLAAYCQAWSDWVRALEQLKTEPRIFKSPNGYPVISPWWSMANKANEQMRAYLSEFGLTPASRSRIHAQPKSDKPDNKLSKYLGKKTA